MTDRVKPIPAGYPGVTPCLKVRAAAAAGDSYCRVFGAAETLRLAATALRLGSSGQGAAG